MALDLEQLYDQHAQALFGFLLNLTRNDADTRDLLQEVFVKLARRPDCLDGVVDTRAFLLRLAHHATIDQVRRRASQLDRAERLAAQTDPFLAPAANPDQDAFRSALDAALLGLPEDQRVVVHLKLREDMTFERIADLLDIPLNTAASRYRYGLDKLRAQLRPLFDEIR